MWVSMGMCARICFVCSHVFMCTSALCAYLCMCVNMDKCRNACLHLSIVYACMETCICACVYLYMCIGIFMYLCTYMYRSIYMWISVCSHKLYLDETKSHTLIEQVQSDSSSLIATHIVTIPERRDFRGLVTGVREWFSKAFWYTLSKKKKTRKEALSYVVVRNWFIFPKHENEFNKNHM